MCTRTLGYRKCILGLANGKPVRKIRVQKYAFQSDGKFPSHRSRYTVDKYIGIQYYWLQGRVHSFITPPPEKLRSCVTAQKNGGQ